MSTERPELTEQEPVERLPASHGTRTFVAVPMYDGRCFWNTAHAAMVDGPEIQKMVFPFQGSNLEHNFNLAWSQAIRGRAEHGITHFAMLHDDICPRHGWLETLHSVMQRTGATLVSAVSPLKNHQGITSTAVDLQAEPHRFRRLTLTECHRTLPRSFDSSHVGGRLLVNTGCMLVDIRDDDFVYGFDGFWITSCVHWTEHEVTKERIPWFNVESEDWLFSRYCHHRGKHVVATTEVELSHWGYFGFSNTSIGQEGDVVGPAFTVLPGYCEEWKCEQEEKARAA